ncbi:uncharacterized protein LOC143471906 [Clavelina lepadiformis]|uniref:uncharacterized protein LOC143471906 n=1 Tax=Clavelina lepadiformis TaxID=159417 RepID=UPI0040429FF3
MLLLTCILRLFLLLTVYLIVTKAKPTKQTSTNDDEDQMFSGDYLESDAFKRKIRKIAAAPKQADIACQIQFGLFYYFSYTGSCESCSVHCSPPTEGMRKECLEHCKDFMTNQPLKNEQMVLKLDVQELRDDLKTTENERKEQYTRHRQTFLGLAVASAVLIVALFATVVYQCSITKRMRQQIARLSPHNITPTGDRQTENPEAVPFTTQCSESDEDSGVVPTI